MSPGTAYSHGKQALRRGAFALAAFAAVATANPSIAVAQDGPGHTVACMKYGKSSPLWLQCEYDASVARTRAKNADAAAADRRGAEADKRGAEADKRAEKAGAHIEKAKAQIADNESQSKCIDFITSGIKSGGISKGAVRAKLAGRPIGQVGACNLAAAFGYNS